MKMKNHPKVSVMERILNKKPFSIKNQQRSVRENFLANVSKTFLTLRKGNFFVTK